MSDEKPIRISMGFMGGQSLTARIGPPEFTRLRQALSSGGWFDLKGEDGTVTLDVAKVVFLQVHDTDHRVGFGN